MPLVPLLEWSPRQTAVHCMARAADIVGTNRAINLPAQMATPDHERMVGFCRLIEGFMLIRLANNHQAILTVGLDNPIKPTV